MGSSPELSNHGRVAPCHKGVSGSDNGRLRAGGHGAYTPSAQFLYGLGVRVCFTSLGKDAAHVDRSLWRVSSKLRGRSKTGLPSLFRRM